MPSKYTIVKGNWFPRETDFPYLELDDTKDGTMRLLIVLCHPREGSFNHAAARVACEAAGRLGHAVYFHDLYSERFDPVLSLEEIRRKFSFDTLVRRCSGELGDAQGLVIFHPEWWGGPPALLKGWIDRVFAPGVAYELEGEEFLEKEKVALLDGKKALVFATSDSPPGQGSSALRAFWHRREFSATAALRNRRFTCSRTSITQTMEEGSPGWS